VGTYNVADEKYPPEKAKNQIERAEKIISTFRF
jgi:hypothetical protein